MDELFKPEEKKRGVNPVFIGGVLVALALIAAAIYLLSFKPSMDDQTAKILEGSYREGAPEFAAITKDILISTDENTVESPTGLGTISMYIKGKIYNKGMKTIDTLEVNVAVVTQKNEVLREKKIVVVPVQQSVLAPGETIPITLTLDGFAHKDDRANIRWKVTAIKAEK
ncbi:MAG: hypothetical protein ABIO36_02320 [Pyrinomonadaceae bacterium]